MVRIDAAHVMHVLLCIIGGRVFVKKSERVNYLLFYFDSAGTYRERHQLLCQNKYSRFTRVLWEIPRKALGIRVLAHNVLLVHCVFLTTCMPPLGFLLLKLIERTGLPLFCSLELPTTSSCSFDSVLELHFSDPDPFHLAAA